MTLFQKRQIPDKALHVICYFCEFVAVALFMLPTFAPMIPWFSWLSDLSVNQEAIRKACIVLLIPLPLFLAELVHR